jgi:hypothetical protein
MLTGDTDGNVTNKSLSRIINKCAAFSPKDRYKNAYAVKRALIRYKNRVIRMIIKTTVSLTVSCLLLAAGFYVINHTDFFKPNPADIIEDAVYIFADPFIEDAARLMLGKSEDDPIRMSDMANITALYFWGKNAATDSEDFLDYAIFFYGEHGTLTDLGDLKYMPNLQEIYLGNQPIEDLSPLVYCELLWHVYIVLCPNLQDISPLASLPRLDTVFISSSGIRDLSPLTASDSLRELRLTMMNRAALSTLQDMDSLRSLYIGFTSLRSLSDLGNLAQVEDIILSSTSLRHLYGIENFTSLVTLNLAGSDTITDFSALDNLPGLRMVFINPGMERNYRATVTREDLSVVLINDWWEIP